MPDKEFEEKVKRRALAASFQDARTKKREKVDRTLSPDQIKFFSYDGMNTKTYEKLAKAMREGKGSLADYIEREMGWLFPDIIPEKDREVILYFASRLSLFPFASGATRRPFRAAAAAPYARFLYEEILRPYRTVTILNAPLHKVLRMELPEEAYAYLIECTWNGRGYNAFEIAYALDRRDREVEAAVREILESGDTKGRITPELLRGIFYSENKEFHALVAKLLVAARLEEGLRQAITENADCGTKEAFFTILSAIEEHHLLRFSSVKRAVGTWLLLLNPETRDLERISEKSLSLLLECLRSPEAAAHYVQSDDSMELYIALWATAFSSLEKALSLVEETITEGKKNRVLVAGYFLSAADLSPLGHAVAERVFLSSPSEDIAAVFLPALLTYSTSVFFLARKKLDLSSYSIGRKKENAAKIQSVLISLYENLGKKEKLFSPIVFPWHGVTLSKQDLAEKICALALLSQDKELIASAIPYLSSCSTNARESAFEALIPTARTELERKTILAAIADKEASTRAYALRVAKGMHFSAEERRTLEDFLRFKADDIRNGVEELLMKGREEDLLLSMERLLLGKKEELRLAAFDLALRCLEDPKRAPLLLPFRAYAQKHFDFASATEKEKLLIARLFPKEEKQESAKETPLYIEEDAYKGALLSDDEIAAALPIFLAYFPDSEIETMLGKKQGLLKKAANLLSAKKGRTAEEADRDLEMLSAYMVEHQSATFTRENGETVVLGEWFSLFVQDANKIPFKELCDAFVKENGFTRPRLFRMILRADFLKLRSETRYETETAPIVDRIYGPGFSKKRAPLPMQIHLTSALIYYKKAYFEEKELLLLALVIAQAFLLSVPDDKVLIYEGSLDDKICREPAHLLGHPQLLWIFDHLALKHGASFKITFPLAVRVADRCEKGLSDYLAVCKNEPMVRMYDRIRRVLLMPSDHGSNANNGAFVKEQGFLFAAAHGLISKEALYAFCFRPQNLASAEKTVSAFSAIFRESKFDLSKEEDPKNWRIRNAKEAVTAFLGHKGNPTEEDRPLLSLVYELSDLLTARILDSECTRGDAPMPYSHAAMSVSAVFGAENFARILSALGSDTLARNGYYGGGIPGRAVTLTHLLSVSRPNADESAAILSAALQKTKVSEKRLIEAALYVPDWIPLVSEVLGIPGFVSAAYYFFAHMNERFDEKRRAIIARYTSLNEEELQSGAFDRDWFLSAYEAVGERTFARLYDAAKYISDGAKHARARKYADAALGKFEVSTAEKEISEKRNKDLLMAYALIPLEGGEDLYRRYLFLQTFKKESKQFGAQRIASEGKAVEIALLNLTKNAGLDDPMRLTLRMEARSAETKKELFLPKEIGGITLLLTVDGDGNPSVRVEKQGKTLKSVPAAIKKDETVLRLTAYAKEMKEQNRRIRRIFEEAMENETPFESGELSALLTHPVVSPLLRKLVFMSGEGFGFPEEDGLRAPDGTLTPYASDLPLRVAHPYHLDRAGVWRDYQRVLFEKKIVQPFRQVYRELYLKTEEELPMYHSLRYAGNQILPKKTLAVLKTRRWIADIEEGLQKVYYKENTVASIYALADWYTPADIEAPTLEYVVFYDRKSGEEKKIAEIPPVLFSEVMRDVDLAVSVAHSGGVDPEAGHSTVEMRLAIATYLLPLCGIKNVTLEDRHAIIKGKRADYSIHLGSGVVHQLGGSMIPVLPIHSSHRGRIFLPFVDDDPKTAEVLSKILYFAEDDQIRDPSVLQHIIEK